MDQQVINGNKTETKNVSDSIINLLLIIDYNFWRLNVYLSHHKYQNPKWLDIIKEGNKTSK